MSGGAGLAGAGSGDERSAGRDRRARLRPDRRDVRRLARADRGRSAPGLGRGSRLPPRAGRARARARAAGPEAAETVLLAERFRLTGVDVSAEQIRRARENVPGAELVLGDLLEARAARQSRSTPCARSTSSTTCRASTSGGCSIRIHGWLRPGRSGPERVRGRATFPAGQASGSAPRRSSPASSRSRTARLVEAAGLTILRDEVVEFVEPEGSVSSTGSWRSDELLLRPRRTIAS